jgi:hypothetical protein
LKVASFEDRWGYKSRAFRIIDNVEQNSEFSRLAAGTVNDFVVLSRDINERIAAQIAVMILAGEVAYFATRGLQLYSISGLAADDRNDCTGVNQRPDLGLGEFATANHKARPPAKVEKYGQVTHDPECYYNQPPAT